MSTWSEVLLRIVFVVVILAVLGALGFSVWYFVAHKHSTPSPTPTADAQVIPSAVPMLAPTTAAPLATPAPVVATPSPYVSFIVYSGVDFSDASATTWSLSSPPFSNVSLLLAAYPKAAGFTWNGTSVSVRPTLASPRPAAGVYTYALAQVPAAAPYLAATVSVPLTTPTAMLPAIVASMLPVVAGGTSAAPLTPAPAFVKSNAALSTGSAGRTLTCKGGGCQPGGSMQIFSPYASTGQQWTYDPSSETLTSGGLCLEIEGNATADGSGIDTWVCNSGVNQKWVPVPSGTGYALKNPFTGKCLDVVGGVDADGTGVQLLTCSGGASQVWK